jgi:carboxyl-terminal processing protease
LIESKTLTDAFYLKYSEVGIGTDHLLKESLLNFIKSGKKKLILDLRNNPGGSLFETKNILNYFINAGSPMMILKYPRAESVTYAVSAPLTDWSQYNIIILVNRDTASAAEVITTSLREYFPKNVLVLGETTYGK